VQRLGATREKRTWQLLALGLLALGVNKQLDLQSAVTELGRLLAVDGGWYESRRQVQRLFVVVIGLVGLALAALFLAYSWKAPRATRAAILGAIALVTFVVMRAASFHHFDLLIRAELVGVKMNWLLEMGAIATVALAARARAATSKAPPAAGRRAASGERRQVPIVVLSEKPVSRPKRR
jgi:hypothetical protein